jgi:hypothetical protein
MQIFPIDQNSLKRTESLPFKQLWYFRQNKRADSNIFQSYILLKDDLNLNGLFKISQE